MSLGALKIALIVAGGAAIIVHAIHSSLIGAFAIRNESMLPYLKPHDGIVILKTSPCIKIPFTEKRWGCTPCETGRAYVFRHPQQKNERLVKFATATKDNACVFEGANSEKSIDSRHFGPVPYHLIEGKVIYPRIR